MILSMSAYMYLCTTYKPLWILECKVLSTKLMRNALLHNAALSRPLCDIAAIALSIRKS